MTVCVHMHSLFLTNLLAFIAKTYAIHYLNLNAKHRFKQKKLPALKLVCSHCQNTLNMAIQSTNEVEIKKDTGIQKHLNTASYIVITS